MTRRCTAATTVPGPWRTSHRNRCLRCQAAAARTRGLERELRSLRHELVPAPPEVASAVMANLRSQDSLMPRRILQLRRLARQATAGIVTAATGVAVTVGLLKRRKRVLISS